MDDINFGDATPEEVAAAILSEFGKVVARDVLVELSNQLDAAGGY
jgi:hypothetical protein